MRASLAPTNSVLARVPETRPPEPPDQEQEALRPILRLVAEHLPQVLRLLRLPLSFVRLLLSVNEGVFLKHGQKL
jgi:hypothetical protein